MLTSCSDYHIFHKLKFRSRKECLESYCEVVDAAFEAGVRPRCHLEDITRSDIEGFVLPFVDRLMEMSQQVPEELSAKIRLCDTMGFGVSSPGAELLSGRRTAAEHSQADLQAQPRVRRAERPVGMART